MNRRPGSYLSGGAEVYLGVECAYLPAQPSLFLQIRPYCGQAQLVRRFADRLRARHLAAVCLVAALLSAVAYMTPCLARLAN